MSKRESRTGAKAGAKTAASAGAKVKVDAGATAGATAGERAGSAAGGASLAAASSEERVTVRKTYKLYIGGKFPRSESGRSMAVTGADGTLLANASRASRKDARDAVVAARKAFPAWSGATAYNRGQVMYRAAEMLEGRAAQLTAEVAAAEGLSAEAAGVTVAKSIDRLVWYAGWTDKLAQVFGAPNPVAGPFLNISEPEPTGVVGLVAPPDSSLLGLVSRLAPILAGGNTAVVLASAPHPLPAITFAEILATSDLPGGVANILTGLPAELVPVLAAHMDVNAIDLAGLDPSMWREVELAAAENVKRVVPPVALAGGDWLDDTLAQDAYWITAFLETKTVWHPAGV
jgi:acyl-CoA reductase-like NAD-dependent aldehyde dehydrogenase